MNHIDPDLRPDVWYSEGAVEDAFHDYCDRCGDEGPDVRLRSWCVECGGVQLCEPCNLAHLVEVSAEKRDGD